MLSIHLVELTLLDEHRYSATLGYLHAAVAAAQDVAPRVDVHKHIPPATPDGQAALLEAVLPDDSDATFVVAFTTYFWNRPQTMAVATEVKAARPNAVIVVGGNDVTNQQHAVFEEAPAVDVLVHGEGELRFVELCRNILDGRDPIEEVLGVSAVRNGSVVTTPAAERIKELDSIPSPLLDPVYDDADRGRVGDHPTGAAVRTRGGGCPAGRAAARRVGRRVDGRAVRLLRPELQRVVSGSSRSGPGKWSARATPSSRSSTSSTATTAT